MASEEMVKEAELAARYWENAKRGAKWADKYAPDWYKKISIPYFKMSDTNQCILGQVFMDNINGATDGYYWAVDHLLDGDQRRAEDLGFDTYYGSEVFSEQEQYEILARAWIYQIQKRLKKKGR